MKTRILVVDDEESIVEFVSMGLRYEGFEVTWADSGRAALDRFRDESPALIVLDVMLPDLDGIEVCRRIRAISKVPVIMLTARGETDDKVLGLESGADDYLAKPFKFKELLARVRALLRRAGSDTGNVLAFGDLTLDRASRVVTRGGRAVELTVREYELLELLMQRPRQVFTREQILNRLWGFDFTGDTNVVEVHVSALRAKIADRDRTLIRTVRGVGYMLGGEGLRSQGSR
ncbi:MAG: response regulator transcription factor [Armatimonadetes bacterium]|nr:response regulator transcription factor [Armatimonadota bacterium]